MPASDTLLKGPITQECKKASGFNLKVETVNANDLQSRITSAIQSGAGADIIMGFGNWPQLYGQSLADVSDLAEELGKAGGGYYDVSRQIGMIGNKWIGVPFTTGGGLIAYRKSWLEEAGYNTFPETWEIFREAGKKLKAKGRPIGQTAGHTFGDAPGWWYPFLWSFGGKEVEADGKTVVLNSKETVELIKYAVALWKETMDEGGLAWDDTNNNRAFLSQTISATNNGASIYIEAKKKPDTYKTEKNTPMWEDIRHAPIPKGVAGQYNSPGVFTDMLMGYSKNQKAGQGLPALDPFQAGLRPVVHLAAGLHLGRYQGLGQARSVGRRSGAEALQGPAGIRPAGGLCRAARPKAAEVVSKYIIVDMYAKAIQGMPAEEAAKWAHSEVAKAYA